MNARTELLNKKKPGRVPMARRQVLNVRGLKDQNEFHYHWMNDVDDRLYNAIEAGYEFVNKQGLSVGDATVESARGTDSLLSKGVGGGKKAYLMRIPIELYNEDQNNKMKEIRAMENEIRGTAKQPGTYGHVEVEQK